MIAAVGFSLFLWVRNPPQAPRDHRVEPAQMSVSGKGTAETSPMPPVRAQSFEERLKEAPVADGSDTAGRDRRDALLLEWLAADRGAAMRYMAGNGFRDVWLPGVTRAIGAKATPSELLAIANGAENPGDALFQVGRWTKPAVINEFAGLMASVNPNAAGPTAGAVSGLLAGLNIDRAVAFAREQATDQMRSFAFSGVLSALGSTPNGEAEVRSLYATLPASIQGNDAVLFSYGNAIWGSDPAGALQALEGISSPKDRMVGLIRLSQTAASAAPETAIAAVYASGVSDQGIYNHVSRILQNWSAVDPQAAANFLSTTQIIPAGDLPRFTPIVTQPGAPKG